MTLERWYCVDRFDSWTLCHDEAHAIEYAKRRDAGSASRAPHRVVHMVDSTEVEALQKALDQNWVCHRQIIAARAEVNALRADNEALRVALVKAEAALADIGDADREPGDDVAWCEARAAEALPLVRAALEPKP